MAEDITGKNYEYAGDPIGADSNALTPGTKVTVREMVAAGDNGAHDDSEDSVVIEWESPSLVYGDSGVEVGSTLRAMSVGQEFFNDNFVGV